MGNVVVGDIVAVVQESVHKQAAEATHGGGEGEMCDWATHRYSLT